VRLPRLDGPANECGANHPVLSDLRGLNWWTSTLADEERCAGLENYTGIMQLKAAPTC